MKKRINNDKILNSIEIDKGNNAVSHTESTGLIPSMPDDDFAVNSYKEIVEYSQKPILRKEPPHSR